MRPWCYTSPLHMQLLHTCTRALPTGRLRTCRKPCAILSMHFKQYYQHRYLFKPRTVAAGNANNTILHTTAHRCDNLLCTTSLLLHWLTPGQCQVGGKNREYIYQTLLQRLSILLLCNP
jgi:hypothetical protein